MSVQELFETCWNGDLQDVPSAWIRVIEHCKAFGTTEQLRAARVEYIKSLPLEQSNQTLILSGRIIKVTTKRRSL